MSQNNPFVVPAALDEASKTQGQRQQAATADNLFSSKALKEEIRRDDAEMVDDVAALRNRKGFTSSGVGGGRGAFGDEDVPLDVHDNMTTEQFILKKREVGLIRMSLEAKKKEIRKLEEEADRAEKKLHQQQSQLETTREKFNNFLKQSNLEQDVAVRKADEETRAKTEKTVEIKKLSAQISRVELDIKKSDAQIESCIAYKKFLGDLVKPKWFQDVLISLRIDDETANILLDAEERFLAQVEELKKKHDALQKESELEKETKTGAGGKKGAGYARASVAPPKQQQEKDKQQPAAPADNKPLEEQVEELHATMEADVQARVTEMEAKVEAEVTAMTPEQARQIINTQYDEARVPPYFNSVDELLEVFISVEEGNLFLIQNCQELEEELEEVAMQFMQERQEMQNMSQQRQSQMDVLAEKIRVAEEKLHQLVARDQALDSGKRESATKAATAATGVAAVVSSSNKRKAEEAAAADVSPEVFKDQMENKIGYIFRTLTAGDTAIKNTVNALNAAKASQDGGDAVTEGGAAAPIAKKSVDTHVDTKKSLGSSTKGASTKSVSTKGTTTVTTTTKGGTATKNASMTGTGKTKGAKDNTTGGAGSTNKTSTHNTNDASHNIGSVEMLTLIENKLEEYHRYITDPANTVNEQLIQQIMKNSDKERRREARHEHMIVQAAEQEERVRRALERSNAPVKKTTGKPVLPRSHVVNEEADAHKKAREAAKNAKDDGDEFFR